MDEPFDLVLALSHPRQLSTRQRDPYALQPWEKNTLETEIVPRAYKTFYQAPSHSNIKANYSTQRVISFTKEREIAMHIQKAAKRTSPVKPSSGNISQQSAVTHYNITGNFLTEPAPKRCFNNQFFVRSKEKKIQSRERGRQVDTPVSSLAEIRKRFSFQKQSSQHQNTQFIRFNSEKEDKQEMERGGTVGNRQKRRSKLISVGFRKISVVRSILKQKSVNLQGLPF